MNVEGKRERPKKRWLKMIENDLRAVSVCLEDVENRDEWKSRIKVANPKLLWERWGEGDEVIIFQINEHT